MQQPVYNQQVNEEDFPFICKISLKPLLSTWQPAPDSHPLLHKFATEIKTLEDSEPQLFEAYDNVDLLQNHQDLVQLILAPVLSCTISDRNLMAVIRPFNYDFLFMSEAFQKLFIGANGTPITQPKVDKNAKQFGRYLSAYTTIAKQCHGLNFDFEPEVAFSINDPDTGLNRHFQIYYDTQFLEVIPRRKLKKLSSEQIQTLYDNQLDLDVWQKIIPPQNYELHGAVIIHASEITQLEATSSLHQALTAGTQLISKKGINLLTSSVRDLLQEPAVKLRLVAPFGDKVFVINSDCNGYAGCMVSNSQQFSHNDFHGTIYKQVLTSGSMLSVKSTAQINRNNPIEQLLYDSGTGSAVLFPLHDEGKTTGILEVGFPEEDQEHSKIALKFNDILSIASIGLKQSHQFLEQGIRSVIQQRCSVIHPAVEWRFREAAFNSIASKQASFELEEIVFRDVYPLFSETDIKGSSSHRNRAIEADLQSQLLLARQLLHAAQTIKAMPILAEMDYRIAIFLADLQTGLRSGDELSMAQFFRQELEPMFDKLGLLGKAVQQAIDTYNNSVDQSYGGLYEKRREYEESVLAINNSITQFLAEQEQQAQQMFPHYFELTCTDGVEMMMYLGAAMVEDGQFDLLYLRNLRLWQLRTTCQIARLCEQLQPELKLPLQTTHLILVQDTPLSIRFSETEKNFIVDGAYNIRYEIMKKRIDKAMVNNGTERLTQPDKIAIVYSHQKEAQEYHRYIAYLQHEGYLEKTVEDLELETMQGLHGLRALRVSVNIAGTVTSGPVTIDTTSTEIEKLTVPSAVAELA